jgi:prepilin-type N-terminal cleavage/methylation domain-containing protein
MKIAQKLSRVESRTSRAEPGQPVTAGSRPSTFDLRLHAAFTMIEIALCLAIIGIALVAIVGVLPIGMNTQRDTREETIIGQDATMLLEAIRNGSRGLDDLTNNVYAITNYWTLYNTNGTVNSSGTNGYTYSSVSITSPIYNNSPYSAGSITNGANIIGLLSLPEFIANAPFTNYPAVPDLLYASVFYGSRCYSNHVVAYIRSLSGLAAEKPPQDNQIMQEDAFSYRLLCVNAPMAVDTSVVINFGYARQLAANLRELRLLFMWPQLPNGGVGAFRQTFRASVGGQLTLTNVFPNPQPLYFYQSQSFSTNTP